MKVGNLLEKLRLRIASTKGIVLLASFFLASTVFSNPSLNNISSGQVSVQQSPNSTVINQSSQKAILNWNSFNIGSQESTHFQQPAGGVALNRISPSQGASQIYGRLTATGQIILVNPAGLFFGPGSYVNVGGMIASTADITDQNFLSGGPYHFTQSPAYPNSSIINEGQIIAAQHGLIAVVAPNVINRGLIEANLGTVALGSGNAFTINFDGNNLISFSVDEKTVNGGSVNNSGVIRANGGKVMVSAKTAAGVLDNVINMGGVVEAKSVGVHNGEIIFSGDAKGGVVKVSGKLYASGRNVGERGGRVKITGNKIHVAKPAVIDVSGDQGGGDIYIGGNYQGKGPLPNAEATVLEPGTQLLADATTYGNGGNIIVWSDNVTRAYGDISARGGATGGDGGFVETSSHNHLDVGDVTVDVRAPYGKTGTWLLDPSNVTITKTNDVNGSFSGGDPNIFSPTGDNSEISSSTLNANLELANVTITTNNPSGTQLGDITVGFKISWSAATTLLLQADNDIFINADISALLGTLALQAGSPTNTITTDANGTINVNNFNLIRGQWTQIADPLPAFVVANNFQIASGIALPGSSQAQFIRALSGPPTGPYLIADIYGLQGIASSATTLAAGYMLNNDIDASPTANWNSGAGFVPIGSDTPFSGTFNGNNHVISNLVINRPASVYDIGFFGDADGATIQNIGLRNATVTAPSDPALIHGILVGHAGPTVATTISNSYVADSTITAGDGFIGGLIGALNNASNLTGSYAKNVVVNGDTTAAFGGIGGLVGASTGLSTISDSYSSGIINVSNASVTPGVGGFVGAQFSGTIQNSYSATAINNTSNGYIGGFAGVAGGDITNSYAAGAVFDAGGIASGAGGFIALGAPTGSNNFWNTETTGQLTTADTISTGITTAQMMAQSTFTGWDFSTVWNIIEGQTFPFLRSIFTSTPRAISGTSLTSGAQPITLASNGAILTSVYTGANSFYYFLEENGVIPDGSALLVYINNGANVGNAVNVAPSAGGSLSGVSSELNISTNFVTAGGAAASTLSNTILGAAKGSLVDSDILYSVSSGNLTLSNNIPFQSNINTTYLLDGNINTVDAGIFFIGPVTLTSSPTLTTTGAVNGLIYFLGSLNSDATPRSLTLNSPTTTILTSVGGTNPLFNLTTDAGGTVQIENPASITVANDLTFNEAVILVNNTTLNVGNALSIVSNVDGSTGQSLTVNNGGTSTISGILGSNITDFTKGGAGILTLSAANTYTGTTLINEGTLVATNNNSLGTTAGGTTIGDGATLDLNNVTIGNEAMTINGQGIGGNGALIGTGTSSLSGNIALATPIRVGGTGQLTLSGVISDGASSFGIDKFGAGTVSLSGANTFDGGVRVFEGTLLATNAAAFGGGALGINGGTMDISNGVNLNNALTLTNGTLSLLGTSTFGSAITLAPGTTNSITTAGVFTLNNDINGAGSLTLNGAGSFTLNGEVGLGTNLTDFTSNTALTLGGTEVITSGDQTYNAPINLVADALFQSTAGSVNVNTTVDGNFNFVVNSAVTSTIGDVLGGGTALNSVDITGAAIALNGGAITTSNNQTYTGPVTLGAPTTLISNSGGGIITFNNTINGAQTLDMSTSPSTNIFNAAIGNTTPLTSISIGGGSSTQFASSVSTTGTQTYSDGIILIGDVIFTGTAISFDQIGTSGGARNLTVNGSGLTTFGNNIIGLASLTTDAAGTTEINAAGISATGNQTYNDPVTLLTSSSLSSSAGDIIFADTLTGNTGAETLTLTNAGASSIISGVISNLSTISKFGVGTLTLAGANTFNGGVQINSGRVSVTNNAGLGTGTVAVNFIDAALSLDAAITIANNLILNSTGIGGTGALLATANSAVNGTIDLVTDTSIGVANGMVLALNGVISGAGDLTKVGSGTLTLNAVNLFTGSTNVDAGTLAIGVNNALPIATALNVNGIFDLNGFSQEVIQVVGPGTVTNSSGVAGTFTINAAGVNPFGGTISGNLALTKLNAGSLSLSGNNTYTGLTTVDNGLLSVLSATALGTTASGTVVNTGASINIGNVDVGAEALTLNGVGSGSGAMTSGGLDSSWAGDITLASNSTIAPSGNLTLSGVISGAGFDLTKAGVGTLILSGANTYTGDTIINAGTIRSGASNVIADASDLVMNAGTFDLNGFTETLGTISGPAGTNILLGTLGSLTTVAVANTTFGGDITGTSASFTKEGGNELTLSGNNTIANLTVNNGILEAGSITAFPNAVVTVGAAGVLDLNGFSNTISSLAGTGNVTLGSGTLTTGSAASTAYDGVISGSGGLNKVGTGTFTLNSTNAYTGPTTLFSGGLAAGANNAFGTGILNLNGGTVLATLGGGVTLANPFTINGVVAIGGVNNLTMNGDGNPLAGTLSNNNTAITTLNGALTGNLAIAQNAGTLILAGNNAGFTGSISLNGGVLDVANNQGLGSASVAVGGGTTLSLSNVTLNNQFTLNNGSLSITGASILNSALILGAGTVNAITANAGALFTLNNNIVGAGALTLQGLGDFALNGSASITSLLVNSNLSVNGTMSTIGAQTYNNPVTLAGNTNFSSTGSTVTLNNTLNGPFAVNITSSGAANIMGDVGMGTRLAGLTVNAPLINVAAANIATSGSQDYTGLVNLAGDSNFSINGVGSQTLALRNGAQGPSNLTLSGSATSTELFMLSGAMNTASVTVDGQGGGNDSLALESGGIQNWNISGSDSGGVGMSGSTAPLTFTSIQNLTGGSNIDNFIVGGALTGNLSAGAGFDTVILAGGNVGGHVSGGIGFDNLIANPNVANTWTINGINSGTVTGVGTGFSEIENVFGGNLGNTFFVQPGGALFGLLSGGSLAYTNTIDYSAYPTQMTVTLTSLNGGYSRSGSYQFTTFASINDLVASESMNNMLVFPTGKPNNIVFTGSRRGFFNDPTTFTGFTTYGGSPGDTLTFTVPFSRTGSTITINGQVMNFEGFSFSDSSLTLDIASIIQQPPTNAENNLSDQESEWLIVSDSLNNNLKDIVKETKKAFDTNLDKIKINPYCSVGGATASN